MISVMMDSCGCGVVLCYACRSVKTLLTIADNLERLYPSNPAMQERAARLRATANEWLAKTTEEAAEAIMAELKRRNTRI